MGSFLDLTGRRFGDLVALEVASRGPTKWHCVCDCGLETVVSSNGLMTDKTKSCGCRRRRCKPDAVSRMPEHGIWRGLISRCENPNVDHYPAYGGSGVTIAPEWRHDFIAFLSHIGPRPSSDHSVDRIDGTKGYEPGNVRWATPIQQMNNRAKTRHVIYRGEKMALCDAVRAAGSVIHYEAAWGRIRTGWPVARALETPRLHLSPNSKPKADNDSLWDDVRAA